MRDPDVRTALVARLRQADGHPPQLLVPEVDIRWTVPARMDALLVSNRICGIEIKSDVDTLARLPRQVEAYGAIVERAVLIVGSRHYDAAAALVPLWWGIWQARWSSDVVVLREVRKGRLNPQPNTLALTSFMSRADLAQALRVRGHVGLSKVSVDDLRQRLVADAGPAETVRIVRSAMLGRHDWRQRCLLAA